MTTLPHHLNCPASKNPEAACLCAAIRRDQAQEYGRPSGEPGESYVLKMDADRPRCERTGVWHIVGMTSGLCVAHREEHLAAIELAVSMEKVQ